MAKGIYKEHYDGSRTFETVWSNKIPLAFVVSAGRSAGKTFSFSKLLYERYLETKEKFVILTRMKGELGSVAEGIMKGMLQVLYPDIQITETVKQKGTYSVITAARMVDDELETFDIGYVIPLRAAGQIKNISSTFVDATCAFMDEFQPLTSAGYLPNEIEMFTSIHASLARGNGSHNRFFPIFMCSNAIDIYNPYFVATRLVDHIQPDTRLYIPKDNMILYENCTVTDVIEQQAGDKFSILFGLDKTIEDNAWLGVNDAAVCKPDNWGRANYLATLITNTGTFAIKYYPKVGLTYVDRTIADSYCTYSTMLNGEINTQYIKTAPVFKQLRKRFSTGQMRFSDTGCKNAIIALFI